LKAKICDAGLHLYQIYILDYSVVARGGIEPPTHGFSVRCSTN
jgi:hypothetical protein